MESDLYSVAIATGVCDLSDKSNVLEQMQGYRSIRIMVLEMMCGYVKEVGRCLKHFGIFAGTTSQSIVSYHMTPPVKAKTTRDGIRESVLLVRNSCQFSF